MHDIKDVTSHSKQCPQFTHTWLIHYYWVHFHTFRSHIFLLTPVQKNLIEAKIACITTITFADHSRIRPRDKLSTQPRGKSFTHPSSPPFPNVWAAKQLSRQLDHRPSLDWPWISISIHRIRWLLSPILLWYHWGISTGRTLPGPAEPAMRK